jgi:hypothetical protein
MVIELVYAVVANTTMDSSHWPINLACITIFPAESDINVIIMNLDRFLRGRGCIEGIGRACRCLSRDDSRVRKGGHEERAQDQSEEEAVRNNHDPAQMEMLNKVWYNSS